MRPVSSGNFALTKSDHTWPRTITTLALVNNVSIRRRVSRLHDSQKRPNAPECRWTTYGMRNADATAAHYVNMLDTYPNGYAVANYGSVAILALNSCDSGSVGATDYTHWHLSISTIQGYPNRLSFAGVGDETCETLAAPEVMYSSARYTGTPPYKITCFPVTGNGWQYESILTQYGK